VTKIICKVAAVRMHFDHVRSRRRGSRKFLVALISVITPTTKKTRIAQIANYGPIAVQSGVSVCLGLMMPGLSWA
jgi:hypothetical protein